MYTDLRDHDGHLLARLDTERWLLEIQRRGEKTLFDLRTLSGEVKDWHIVHPAPRIQVEFNPAPMSAEENDGERRSNTSEQTKNP
jgi:hypothetical protein